MKSIGIAEVVERAPLGRMQIRVLVLRSLRGLRSRCAAARLAGSACGALAAVVMAVFAVPAAAGETGLTYFPYGAQTVYAGLTPPPGKTLFLGYTQFYDAGSFRDADGVPVSGVSAQAFALAPRILHTWNEPLWGFKATSGILALAVSVGIDTPLGESFDYGPTLLGIEPLYLSRSFGAWHSVFGAVIYLPLGSYDDQSPANAALDRYGGALNGGLTWTPTPRWDLSLNLGYEFKGRNRHTQYRDGQQTGMSYGVAYRPFADMRWDVGVSGFYTVQVEDDRQSGHVIADRRVRKFAVGPKASFWFTPAASVILQFHREYETRNAPRGDLFWLMFSFPLGS
jgi:hypothetical protein